MFVNWANWNGYPNLHFTWLQKIDLKVVITLILELQNQVYIFFSSVCIGSNVFNIYKFVCIFYQTIVKFHRRIKQGNENNSIYLKAMVLLFLSNLSQLWSSYLTQKKSNLFLQTLRKSFIFKSQSFSKINCFSFFFALFFKRFEHFMHSLTSFQVKCKLWNHPFFSLNCFDA